MQPRLRHGDFFSARTRSARFGATEWEEAAVALGVLVDHGLGGGDAFFGSRGELAVAIGRVMSGDRFVTRYRFQYPAFEFGLQMLGRSQDPVFDPRSLPPVATGHDALDAVVEARTDDVEALGAWLDSGKVALLRDMFRRYSPLEVSSVAVVYESQFSDTIDQVIECARDLLACVAVLRVPAPRVESPAPPRATLDIPGSLTSVTAGRGIEQGRKQTDDGVTIAGSPTAMAELDRIVDTMLSNDELSFDADDRLRDLVGTTVRWTGTLRSVRPFESDLDFGSEPGVKATVTIRKVAEGGAGSSLVDAVVGLPPGSASRLDRGDEIVVEGRIVRIDSLMKTVVLGDGHLVPGT